MRTQFPALAALALAAGVSAQDLVLGPDQSVGPGQSQHLAPEGTVVFADGFELHGGSLVVDGGGARTAQPRPAANGLRRASLANGMLRLDYALQAPGPVTAEAFLGNGKRIGRWTWRDASAGSHARELALRARTGKAPLFLRLSSGSQRFTQRVSTTR